MRKRNKGGRKKRKPETRGTPSKELLQEMARRAKVPRHCCRCGKKWENQPTTNPHRLFCSDTHRKYMWRRGIDSADFIPIRLEAELLERQFERDLAEHRAKVKAGVI